MRKFAPFWRKKKVRSRPISRVLSWTTIHLGEASPPRSCSLPERSAGRAIAFLFGLAPDGVYPAAECYHRRGALLPHLFTLTSPAGLWRYIFCGTFHRLTPPRCYLAPCPVEPGLSSKEKILQRLSGRHPGENCNRERRVLPVWRQF